MSYCEEPQFPNRFAPWPTHRTNTADEASEQRTCTVNTPAENPGESEPQPRADRLEELQRRLVQASAVLESAGVGACAEIVPPPLAQVPIEGRDGWEVVVASSQGAACADRAQVAPGKEGCVPRPKLAVSSVEASMQTDVGVETWRSAVQAIKINLGSTVTAIATTTETATARAFTKHASSEGEDVSNDVLIPTTHVAAPAPLSAAELALNYAKGADEQSARSSLDQSCGAAKPPPSLLLVPRTELVVDSGLRRKKRGSKFKSNVGRAVAEGESAHAVQDGTAPETLELWKEQAILWSQKGGGIAPPPGAFTGSLPPMPPPIIPNAYPDAIAMPTLHLRSFAAAFSFPASASTASWDADAMARLAASAAIETKLPAAPTSVIDWDERPPGLDNEEAEGTAGGSVAPPALPSGHPLLRREASHGAKLPPQTPQRSPLLPLLPAVEISEDCIRIRVEVLPDAAYDHVVELKEHTIAIALEAPISDGWCNQGLLAFMRRALHMPQRERRALTLENGKESLSKTIWLPPIFGSVREVCRKLESAKEGLFTKHNAETSELNGDGRSRLVKKSRRNWA